MLCQRRSSTYLRLCRTPRLGCEDTTTGKPCQPHWLVDRRCRDPWSSAQSLFATGRGAGRWLARAATRTRLAAVHTRAGRLTEARWRRRAAKKRYVLLSNELSSKSHDMSFYRMNGKVPATRMHGGCGRAAAVGIARDSGSRSCMEPVTPRAGTWAGQGVRPAHALRRASCTRSGARSITRR